MRYLQNEAESSIPPSTPENNVLITSSAISNLNTNKRSRYRKETPKPQRSNSICEISENKIFNLDVREPKVKLPSLELLKPLQKKKLYKNTYSLDNCKLSSIRFLIYIIARCFLVPEEYEDVQESPLETRNAFSSPQERTDFNENLRTETPFGRPSKQQNLSQCLLLEPQNLTKIFDNKQIVQNSETLFIKTGYFHKFSNNSRNPKPSSLEAEVKEKTVDDVINILNVESIKKNNDDIVIECLNDLYDCMEKEDMLNNKVSSKTKIYILKCLYKYVESQNEKLLLGIARVILAVRIRRSFIFTKTVFS